MATFNVEEFTARYRERAKSVKNRGIPPVEGEARRAFIKQAEDDYTDYSLVAGAQAAVEDGFLVLRIPLG